MPCRLRASQINGCGFCTDMHTKDALAAGEDAQRLHLVAAWREATVFTDAERPPHRQAVTQNAWLEAAKHYDDGQLAALTLLIATINAFNRLTVISRQPAGDYVPGQFAS